MGTPDQSGKAARTVDRAVQRAVQKLRNARPGDGSRRAIKPPPERSEDGSGSNRSA